MSRSAASVQRTPFLPPAAALGLIRLSRRMLGFALLTVTAAGVAALLSYHPSDASWNVASPAPPLNLMGIPGALLADLLFQSFGHAALIPCLGGGVLALRLLTGDPIRWGVAPPLALLAAMPLAAMALAMALPSGTVPSWAGAGGAVGSAANAWSLHLMIHLAPRGGWDWVPAVFATVAGLWLVIIALGLRWHHIIATRDGLATAVRWIRVGTVAVTTFGSAVARVGTTLTRAARRERTERHEPTLTPAEADPEPRPQPNRPRRAVVEPPPRQTAARAARETLRARQGSLFGDHDADSDGPILPSLDLLTPPRATEAQRRVNEEALANNARLLEGVLGDFGIKGEIVKVRPGPVVTLYELEPAPGIKTARIIGLADDIARAMSAVSVRIAVIPGKSVIGIELPNARRQGVNLREMLANEGFAGGDLTLTLALGRDIGGGPMFVDLARMPHLLIAGTTGSGKSVAVNAMILSLLYRLPPERCRLILIDPKMLELSAYDDIPHLLTPVVTDPRKAVVALKWAVTEMENRYRAMSQMGVRNIHGFNRKVEKALADGGKVTRTIQTGFDPETGEPIYEQQEMDLQPLPHIVIVVDEMADLMLVAGKEVEGAIQRLAQMARAAGLHLIMATQRPSVDVITGTIKANFPTRVSFQVTSKIDSRTILGEQGAEQLLGQGDMLYMAAGGRITRLHGPFVSDEEVERVCDALRGFGTPAYVEAVTVDDEANNGDAEEAGLSDPSDPLFDRAVELVARERKASTSFVQRHLQIGYNRAARIIDVMEKEGMVSRANHVGKREVLLPEAAE
ncbi:FtsK/SpoIIIE family DNA translocase [Rhodospira trueperi]|uniref:DNA translocase FtsK n=1 Tax=Rhodospira trueperi TaxID=69960 RepID=A0A1G7BNI6_9PROT|nr:DNA translocase FtsK 4TM domain-containing protein [Rhodospira trueperi]SDE28629.1 DNA segregation ATPase FtsK/SpoIIIE, S-DNA-T family [Rhodospira trueperi]